MSQSIEIKNVISMQLCHVELRRLPFNDVAQVSRYHESSVEQNKQDKISNDHADGER